MAHPQVDDTSRLDYQPLGSDEIRLLRIHPLSASPKDQWKSWKTPISCDLEHYPLVEPGVAEDLSNRLAKPGAAWDSSTPTLGIQISPSSKVRLSKRRRFKELFTRRQPGVQGRFAWGDYVALSYTWGKEDATEEIIVNGVPVKIRPNLESALRVLRDKAPVRAGMKIWIDALCINQDDTDERNAQVPRMREIYQRAFNVVVWLGPETDTSTSALSLVRILAASWHEDEGKTLAKTIGENPYFWQTKIKHDGGSLRNCWQGLQSLILADYWKRVWIVQEVAMGGRSSPLLQGDACVEFGQVCDAAAKWMIRYARVASTSMLNDCMSDPALKRRMDELKHFRDNFEPTQENIPELVNRYNQMMNDIKAITDTQNSEQWAFHIDRITFVESLAVRLAGATTMTSQPGNLVALGRSSEATQAQDKIFAFLSLMDSDFAQRFQVDYTLSASEVYTDFSIKWIQHSKSLDLFVHCLIEHNHTPSWVPDWNFNADMPSMYIGEVHDNYRAGGLRTLLDLTFSADGTELKTLGMFADAIDGLSTADDEPADRIRNGSATFEASFDAIRKALFMTFVAGRERKDADSSEPQDPDGPSFLDVPLPSNYSASLPEPYQRTIYKFIDTNRSFLINGVPLEAYFANGGARVEISDDSRPEISRRVEMHLQIFAASLLLQRRRLATTKFGTLALVPRATEPGDLVAVLVGCGQPVVLRPGEGSFRVVGTAYVQGLMEGEMMTEENVLELGVEICLT